MGDIVKEISDVEANGGVKEKENYFIKETLISRKYFNNEVISKYPNLEFIRIFMKKTIIIPTFHESMRDEEYYLYSVFIDKNILEYIAGDILIGSLNGEKIIDLSQFRWEKQLQLRNKILTSCPIIVAECNYFYNNMEQIFSNINMDLCKNISIYPYDYKIDDYELINSTRFILISNSELVDQEELNNLCLEMLGKLSYENKRVIDGEKAIYLSISDKLKRNRTFTQEERIILEQFINNEMNKVDRGNTLLIRSRKMDDLKRGIR